MTECIKGNDTTAVVVLVYNIDVAVDKDNNNDGDICQKNQETDDSNWDSRKTMMQEGLQMKSNNHNNNKNNNNR